MREIIFDTETTGLDPAGGHRVIEIGCVEMVHKLRTGRTFHEYINPLRDVPAEAQAVHGISSDFLLDKPVFADIADAFLEFVGEDGILVAHNANFDMKFINHELKSHGYYTIPDERVVDTLAITRTKFPGSPASLDALCRRFEIDLSRRDKHGALLDAELLAEVYVELCGGRQVGIDFALQAEVTVITQESINYDFLGERTHTIRDAEYEAHQAFIAKLENAIWKEYSNT